jgi:hypothetical protein
LPATMTRTHHSTRDYVTDSMMTIACCWWSFVFHAQAL